MNDQKKEFQKLFVRERSQHLTIVLQTVKIPTPDQLEINLKQWKLHEYFEIQQSYVIRNDKPTGLDRIKNSVIAFGKKAAKYFIDKGLPAALALATGSLDIKTTLSPVKVDVIKKFQDKGIIISPDNEQTLEHLLQTKEEHLITEFISKIKRDNSNFQGNLDTIVKLLISEEIKPFISFLNNVFQTITQHPISSREVMEEWMAEQRVQIQQIHEEQIYTNEKLNQLETDFNDRFACIEDKLCNMENQFLMFRAQMDKMLNSMDKMFYGITDVNYISNLNIDELFELSRIQFQNIRLSGKWDEPFDPSLFIPNLAIDSVFHDFLTQKGFQKPIFLLLANMGMG